MCRRSVLVVFLGVPLLLHCSAALHIFHYSVVFRLFCQYSVVPPVFRFPANVPVFHRCSVLGSSVFWCSWFYSIPTKMTKFTNTELELESESESESDIELELKSESEPDTE